MFRLVPLMLFLIILPRAHLHAQKTQPETYQVPEAYEVYASILPGSWPVTVAHSKKLLIRAETGTGEMCLKAQGESVQVVGPAIDNFTEVNKKTRLLEKAIQIEQPYEFIFA